MSAILSEHRERLWPRGALSDRNSSFQQTFIIFRQFIRVVFLNNLRYTKFSPIYLIQISIYSAQVSYTCQPYMAIRLAHKKEHVCDFIGLLPRSIWELRTKWADAGRTARCVTTQKTAVLKNEHKYTVAFRTDISVLYEGICIHRILQCTHCIRHCIQCILQCIHWILQCIQCILQCIQRILQCIQNIDIKFDGLGTRMVKVAMCKFLNCRKIR